MRRELPALPPALQLQVLLGIDAPHRHSAAGLLRVGCLSAPRLLELDVDKRGHSLSKNDNLFAEQAGAFDHCWSSPRSLVGSLFPVESGSGWTMEQR